MKDKVVSCTNIISLLLLRHISTQLFHLTETGSDVRSDFHGNFIEF